MNSAEGRDRTGTVVTYRRILSPVRLPIPPPRHHKSGRRDSNPRPQPWQGCILPLNYFRMTNTVSYTIINGAGEGTRTPTPKAPDPKSGASANSATPANVSHEGLEPSTL